MDGTAREMDLDETLPWDDEEPVQEPEDITLHTNNWRHMHGYPMHRFHGRRRGMTVSDYFHLPFPCKTRKYRKFCCRKSKSKFGK